MNIKRIVLDSEKSLRQKSIEVSYPYSKKDIDDCLYLHEYLVFASKIDNQQKYKLRAGVGLAAPQIGINKRMIGIYITSKNEDGNEEVTCEYALINPKIISKSVRASYLRGGEGCLSVNNDHEGYVVRNANIVVSGYDCLSNKDINIKLRGYEAIVFQHEIDHLDGVLFYDRINKKDPFHKIDGALVI